ncbi:hypothetical protein CHI06_06365 [Bacillus sp. 7884-1]|nr:hypothetical protein CHI06_06365 [Bacillus sp. 7884-1]
MKCLIFQIITEQPCPYCTFRAYSRIQANKMVTNLYKESVRGEESFEAFVDSVGDMIIHYITA